MRKREIIMSCKGLNISIVLCLSLVSSAMAADAGLMPGEVENSAALSGDQCFDIKGSASTENVDQTFARKMAIRDALKQASMKSNLSIKTDQSVENYQLKLDSARFTSASKIKSFTVIKEGMEDAEDMYGQTKQGALNYEVFLKVCLSEERGICPNLPGNQYQNRLAVAPVVMPYPQQAGDVANLLSGYQLELERRIKNQGYKNFTLVKGAVDVQPNIQVTPNMDSEALASYRDQTGAQYLLMTVIRSMASETAKKGYSLEAVENTMKRLYGLNVAPSKRYLEIEWFLVDLIDKKLVHQSRSNLMAEGKVYVGRDKVFGSSGFFATETGKAFDALLEKQVTDSLDYLHCKPFQTEVIDVRNNEYIVYLNEDSGAKVGDDLAVYHRVGRPVSFNGIDLGSDYEPGAFLKIKRVLPKFAIAELTVSKQVVQIGDRVKTW